MEVVTFFYFILSYGLAIIITLVRWIITKRLPRFGCLFILLIFIFLILFSHLLFSIHSHTSPYPSSVQNILLENLYITASTSFKAQKDHSQEVKIDITGTKPYYITSRSLPASTTAVSQPKAIGTPQVPIQRAFGPNYDVSAVAQLAASAFDIDPKEQPEQSLDQQDNVSFVWTITPKFSGSQVIYISVTGIWANGSTIIKRPLGNLTLDIDVADPPPPPSPFINMGQINASDIIMVFLGSALNIQWIWGLVQERRKAKKQKKQSPSPSQKKLPTRRGKTKKGRKV